MDTLATLQNAIGHRYRLERELGSGGMARVYLAEDRKRQSLVAIKVLRPELTVLVGATRFHREIDILTRLHHPHILPVLDSNEAGVRLYYVMPYVAGDSLQRRLEREVQFSLPATLAVARDVAAALDHAHSMEIIHRDIKPGNILMDREHSFVCDFGIAHAVEVAGGEALSSSGIALGTPAYMSPEQAMGHGVDVRTDVYSLGCVIYEMLAGELPFTGSTSQAVVARIVSGEPHPLRTIRPDVPRHVEEGILRALAKLPEDRPRTAGELVTILLG
jgi:eukaryotic-like serine/threonine-protein kinase